METEGSARTLEFSDHYRAVAALDIIRAAPEPVRNVYRRALHCLLYAWFDYEFMVTAEAQALAGFELALTLRLNRPAPAPPLIGLGATLREAIAAGYLPPPDPSHQPNEYFLLRSIRNDLAHGASDIHPPALAIEIIRRCAELINLLHP